MTSREFYTAIANELSLSSELRDYATACIVKLDARNTANRTTRTKEQVANDALKTSILGGLTQPMFASEVAKAFNISTQKASALLIQLVNDGSVQVADVKVKNRGTVKQYSVKVAE